MQVGEHHGSGARDLWVALIPLAAFSSLVWGLVHHELPWSWSLPWVPSLGIELAFRIDGLSAQMLALITGIGVLVFVYACGYLAGKPRRGRVYFVLPLFMLAMIGAVSADDVILFFLFWELTSITSFLLVGFNHEDSHARASARQALLITMGGGLAMLGGLLLLAQMAGTYNLSGIIAAAPQLKEDPRLHLAITLVLLGAFTKSAQFPFHFWLPNAMSAPTPVSAYLHSATMVKLGIYLLLRLDPAFNDLLFWEIMLVGTGAATALWTSVLALRERDLKRILARSTVAALGTLTLLVGLPSEGAGLAAVAFLFAHAIYKAPLFMVAGNIDHATGTRIIDHLMGLRRFMPWSAAAALLAGLSMAGLPLAFGFVSKDLITTAKSEADLVAYLGWVLVLVNAIAVAVAAVAAIRVFWGKAEVAVGQVHEVPWTMILPPLAIALLGIEFELLPHIADPLLIAAAKVVSPGLETITMDASYDLTTMLSAVGLTAGIGILLFIAWDRIHARLHRIHWLDRYGPEATYDILLHRLAQVAAWHTRGLQHGRLSGYLRLTITALILISLYAAWQGDSQIAIQWHWPEQAWAWLVACLLILAGALSTLTLQDRLALLMASGLVGYGSALLFLFAGAPDLAFTQFMVETILVVVAAAVLPRFEANRQSPAPDTGVRWGDLALASAAGIGIIILLLNLQGLPVNPQLPEWFAAQSLPGAQGHNVVNVIIVDFRALDTLGEIAVVAFSLLAALPLLAGAKGRTQCS
jgi:multicomponent Na+:H+ antiporter subunit A